MSIYVGNLPYEVSQEDLTAVFKEYGSVQRIHFPTDQDTGKQRGFAFVELETKNQEASAINALNGAEWMGRELKVNLAREREDRGSSGRGRKSNRF